MQIYKLKSLKYWLLHTRSKDFPKDIHAYPNSAYKKEWKGWPDFLGKKTNG